MNEAIKSFIGKECIITMMNATITGVVESVEDNWITVHSTKKSGSNEIINIDYINRIQKYPKTNKGRKKLVIM
jgi:hypothetical protein